MEIPSLTSVFHRDAYPAISPSRPELSVAGKTVLITGGGRGIGKSITTAFAHAGASHIVILGRDASTLEAVKAEIEGKQDNKSKVHVFPAEISNESRMNEVFDTVVKTIGKIDVCVANAAYLNAPASVPTVSIEDFWRCFEVNVKGLLITTQAFLRSASDASVFINITSGAGQLRYFGPMSAYASSKAAGMRLMDYLTMDCPNVRVYSLQPGIIDTDMARKASAGSAKFTELDTPELPAAFCVWLASPEADFLSGKMVYSNWDVDEMIAKKEEIAKNPDFLTLQLVGWFELPFTTTLKM